MIIIPHKDLSIDNLDSIASQDHSPSIIAAIRFISSWLNETPEFVQQTSGSTGPPKEIKITREQMLISARETLEYLQIGPGGTALVCLSTEYIAGKMMIVRAIENMMDIILEEPTADPLYDVPKDLKIDLASMVPIQVSTTHSEHGHKRLEQIWKLLIGGSDIPISLEHSLTHLKGSIYHTYGMTETVSHIALRSLNDHGTNEYFTTLPGVLIRAGELGTLEIKAAVTNQHWIQTNDLVEIINEHTFRYLGRVDNVIITGSVKVYPEKVESQLYGLLNDIEVFNDFFVTGTPDRHFGHVVTLIMEGQPEFPDEAILHKIREVIHDYSLPRKIIYIPGFRRTANGKIKRQETLSLISYPSDE